MEKHDVHFLDLVAALHANRRLIIIATLLFGGISLGFSYLLPEKYEATVQLLPPKEQKKGFGFADLIETLPIPSLRLGEKGTPADIFIAIIHSETVRRWLIDEYNLMQVYDTEFMIDALESLEKHTTVTKSEQGTILISVLDEIPQRAADMANRYCALLDTMNQRIARGTARERYQFIVELKAEEEVHLEAEMQRLQEFQSRHNAIAIDDQARAVIRAASDMQTSTMELEIRRQSLLAAGFTPNHAEVRKTEREIALWNEALMVLKNGTEEPAVKSVGNPTGVHLQLEENLFLPLSDIPKVAQDYALIEKDVAVQSALIRMLLQQEAESLIESENTTSTVQVLDEGLVPEKKAWPKRFLIVFIAATLSFIATTTYALGSAYASVWRQRWATEYRHGHD